MYACDGLGASEALSSAFKGGEHGGWTVLTVSACSNCEGNGGLTVNHRSALLLGPVVGLCLEAFSWVGVTTVIGRDRGVYWGCCCSCMMLFWICALLVTLVLLLGSFGSWTGRLKLTSTWPCVLRLECGFRSWYGEGRGKNAWLDGAMEPEKCKLEPLATSAMFPAGDELTHSWTISLILTEFFSVKSSLFLPVLDTSDDCFDTSDDGCSSYLLAMFFLKLLYFHFSQLGLCFIFRTLSSNAQLCLMFLIFLFFSSSYF